MQILNSTANQKLDTRGYDSFGSLTLHTNTAGVAVDATHPAEVPASVLSMWGYAGREHDAATDLNYSRARWYSPAMGRFINEDPLGPAPASYTNPSYASPVYNSSAYSSPVSTSISSGLYSNSTASQPAPTVQTAGASVRQEPKQSWQSATEWQPARIPNNYFSCNTPSPITYFEAQDDLPSQAMLAAGNIAIGVGQTFAAAGINATYGAGLIDQNKRDSLTEGFWTEDLARTTIGIYDNTRSTGGGTWRATYAASGYLASSLVGLGAAEQAYDDRHILTGENLNTPMSQRIVSGTLGVVQLTLTGFSIYGGVKNYVVKPTPTNLLADTSTGVRSANPTRSLSERIADFRANPSNWEEVAVSAEQATSRRAAGGVSLERSFVNKQTGEPIRVHDLFDAQGRPVSGHPSFRDYGKGE